MKVAAILLARTLAFVETADINPRGQVFFPDLTNELVKRYNFQVFPQTPDQFDQQKGVVFRAGRFNDKTIESFTIFDSLLVLETRSNTSDSKEIIEEMLEWGNKTFGLNYEPKMIRHWAYVSDITFHSDFPLLAAANTSLSRLAQKTSEAVSTIWRERVDYEPNSLAINHDPLKRLTGIAALTISYRANVPFSENKYFSEAPLPTDQHIKLLKEFEEDVRNSAS